MLAPVQEDSSTAYYQLRRQVSSLKVYTESLGFDCSSKCAYLQAAGRAATRYSLVAFGLFDDI